MWKMLQKAGFILLLLCVALLVSGTCYAAGQTYTITETELQRLESNLAQLESNNKLQQKELIELQAELQTVLNNLELAKKELELSKQALQIAQYSLRNAETSLGKYEKEVRRVKAQRNFYAGLAIAGVGFGFSKSF